MESNGNSQPGNAPELSQKPGMKISRTQWLMAGGTLALLVLALWYISAQKPGPGQAAPATSKEAVPELAREVISEQQQEQVPDYPSALEQARKLRSEGKLADAQLLYFFAARGGYAPAAFELAELYDPLHFDASTSLMKESDSFQAFKWYRQASQSGIAEATARIEALHGWAKQAAEEGNLDAEQLLLQWD